MAVYNPIKVTSLPATPAENSVYYVKGASDTRIRLFVTDNSGTAFPVGYVDDDDILSVPLTGYSVGSNTALAGTDSILLAFGKVQGQLNNLSTAVADGIKVPIPIDCSGNPNYPSALKGDSYIVTNGGRIGGASGIEVRTGDKIVALQDNAGGTQASVGSSWFIMEGNRQDATESVTGFTRIATESEANTGTESFAYVTPLRLRGGVRATTLTGYTVGSNTALSDSDSILQAFGKIQGQINARLVGTTIGRSMLDLTNPSSITFPRLNADNSVSALSASDFRTAIGAQATLTNPVTGTGASGRVAFWDGTGSIGSDSAFTFNDSSKLLTLGGSLTLTGAQTIQTSTGNLTLATGGGNGNILLSPHGTGNVGIGTSSPGVKLEVYDSSNAIIRARGDVNGAAYYITQAGSNNTHFAVGDDNSIVGGAVNTLVTYFSPSVPHRWYINGAERMRITSAGNVGIGTTSPVQRLTINGNVLAEGVGNGFLLDTLGVQFTNGMKVVNNFETVVFSGRGPAGYLIAGDDNLRFGFGTNYSEGESMRITSAGNALIGTTSELTGGGRLQVSGGVNISSIGNATGDFVTHSGGLLTKRTATQVRTEIVTWTEVGW